MSEHLYPETNNPKDSASHNSPGNRQSGVVYPYSIVFADFRESLEKYYVAAWLGWQDTTVQYKRTFIGPVWIAIQTGLWVAIIGSLLGSSLSNGMDNYLLYVTIGMVGFQFLSGFLVDGGAAFTRNANLIQNIPNPLSLYLFRVMFKSLSTLVFNFPVVLIVLAFPMFDAVLHGSDAFQAYLKDFRIPIEALYFIPGLLLAIWVCMGAALVLACVTPWYRDIPFALNAVMRIMFFVTPIFWVVDGSGIRGEVAIYNPLAHLLNIIRAPLLGDTPNWDSLLICAVMGIISWCVGMYLFARTRPFIAMHL